MWNRFIADRLAFRLKWALRKWKEVFTGAKSAYPGDKVAIGWCHDQLAAQPAAEGSAQSSIESYESTRDAVTIDLAAQINYELY